MCAIGYYRRAAVCKYFRALVDFYEVVPVAAFKCTEFAAINVFSIGVGNLMAVFYLAGRFFDSQCIIARAAVVVEISATPNNIGDYICVIKTN